MKKFYILTVAAFLTGMQIFDSQAYAQRKVVAYTTSTSKYFAIPQCIEIESLTDIDFVWLMPQKAVVQFSKFEISNDNMLTITYEYQQRPRYEGDYENMVGKVVSSAKGTVLYDHEGIEMERVDEDHQDEVFILSTPIIDKYGIYNEVFHVDPSFVANMLKQAGLSVFLEGHVLIGSGENMEIMFDFHNFVYEERFFKEQILEHLTRTEYEKWGEHIIPSVETSISYGTLPSEIRYQITEVKSYLSYQVLQDGNVIIHKQNAESGQHKNMQGITQFDEIKQRETDLCIYPNPANDHITVVLPFYMTENVQISIINPVGTVVFMQQSSNGEQKISFNINQLPSGIYFVRCETNQKVKMTRFVKQ
jgi:hypothetical protein